MPTSISSIGVPSIPKKTRSPQRFSLLSSVTDKIFVRVCAAAHVGFEPVFPVIFERVLKQLTVCKTENAKSWLFKCAKAKIIPVNLL
jgi:hypothetical protein